MSILELHQTVTVKKTQQSQLSEVDWEALEFGKYVSDHMFLCSYDQGAWQEAAVLPYQNLSLAPTTLALHYGQSIFEGMKAFRQKDGRIAIFRIEKHHDRLNRSLDRMCMPPVPYELFEAALTELIRTDRDWVPRAEGSALYIRPLIFASEARFGVKVSDQYQFVVITGPSPMLYAKPIKVKVERNYIRAAKGGTGYAKCAGNYGGAFYPTQQARAEGFDQVLWTDAGTHEYFEESGTMNLLFALNGTLITPPLSDTILDGITRDSLLQLAADLKIPCEERQIGIQELVKAIEAGDMVEAFGAGTAAVIAPIASFSVDGRLYEMPVANEQSCMHRLKQELDAIRYGHKEDRHNWNYYID
ncbi:MAG TPA: branched-chain amino acid aminotransferase [Flavisolibacter sp.]|jgi:branched-chain amino acid aminotransferase|nr:branched-chain amino acid aminotransferase [Flavisolibacter sp.]